MVAPEDEPAPEALRLYEQLKAQEDAEDRCFADSPLHPSLPYQVDTSRPSLRTNWTCLEDRERTEAAAALERARRSAQEAESLREEVREMARYDVGDDWADA
jgi:hypothetical protein